MITRTTRSTALAGALALIFSLHTGASGMVPDSADRAFLNRAMAASEAELKIARMARRNAGREEILALAQRLATYHVRLAAALREFARLRKAPLSAASDPKLARLLKSFEGKKGRAYDEAFRDLLARDSTGLIPLYGAGAAGASDRLLRRLAERVYGELKTLRPAAARAHIKQQVSAAQEKRKTEAAAAAKAKAKAKPKAAGKKEKAKSSRKEPVSRGTKAPRSSTISSPVKRGARAGAAASPDKQQGRTHSGSATSIRR